MPKQKKNSLQGCLLSLFFICGIALIAGIIWLSTTILNDVKIAYGPPDASLNLYKRFVYTTKLYFSEESLFKNQNNLQQDFYFEILAGESVGQIA